MLERLRKGVKFMQGILDLFAGERGSIFVLAGISGMRSVHF